jgi:hypothetical protein
MLQDRAKLRAILREIGEAMTPGERARLNSPITARQRVEKVLKAREGGTEEKKMRASPVTQWKDKVAALERENALLKSKLEAAEKRDGSLFDLQQDTVADIASTIVRRVTESKAHRIAKAIQDELKAKKLPAG